MFEGLILGLHLLSFHAPAKDFNNVNPGFYIRANNGFTAGAFYNSERHTSVYAGVTHAFGPVDLTFGLITGYRRAKVLPMLAPSYKLNKAVRIVVLPSPEAVAVHLTMEF